MDVLWGLIIVLMNPIGLGVIFVMSSLAIYLHIRNKTLKQEKPESIPLSLFTSISLAFMLTVFLAAMAFFGTMVLWGASV